MSVIFPRTARLDFEWEEGSPSDINYKLAQLEGYLENTVVLSETIKERLIADMEMKFETETDPSGAHWQELVKPEPEQIGILRRGSTDAAMYTAATDESSWQATPVGVFFDTGALPPYWAHHEQPDGGQYRIPQRAFIGPSPDVQSEVTVIAGRWMDVGVARAVSRSRGMSFRSPTTGRMFTAREAVVQGGQVGSIIGGTFRREVRDPATGRFVSTRPNFGS